MSEKRYYTDAYTHQFQAALQEIVTENGRFALILNHTYFYPTSGGQPHDTGTINKLRVTDVTLRDTDNAILHWIDGKPPQEQQLTAKIDWARRFDHMQQHTGQHILSQAFLRVAEAATESFHLSDQSVTIDLDTDALTPEQFQQVEQLANDIIWENRPIHSRMVTPTEAQQLPLRKIPAAERDTLRLIDIDNFDLTACGGTHVAATGAVGLIKIIKSERRRGNLRIEFCCGARAVSDYQQKHTITSQLTNTLTTGLADLPDIMERLRTENKQLKQSVKEQQTALLEQKAAQLQQQAEKVGPFTVITYIHNGDANELRALAHLVTSQPATIALLGAIGAKTNLLFARSGDATGDMKQLLQEAFRQLGTGSGGGNAKMAQGGGTAVSVTQLTAAINHVKKQLLTK
ncbi:MAG: hypothetical protein KC419_12730 [Anaerolineales bacterium]|nr:hypothetical protein [Anaerolineales bacterium]